MSIAFRQKPDGSWISYEVVRKRDRNEGEENTAEIPAVKAEPKPRGRRKKNDAQNAQMR